MGDAEGEHEAAALIDVTVLCVAVNLSPRYGLRLRYEHGPAERLTAPGSRVGFAERDARRP